MANVELTDKEVIAQKIAERKVELEEKAKKYVEDELKNYEKSFYITTRRKEIKATIDARLKTVEDNYAKAKKEAEVANKLDITNFYTEFNVPYDPLVLKPRITATPIEHKLNFVSGLTNIDGTPKYKLNDDATAVIGAKGEELKSTIVFKFNGRKQTLNAKNLLAYLKGLKDKGEERNS